MKILNRSQKKVKELTLENFKLNYEDIKLKKVKKAKISKNSNKETKKSKKFDVRAYMLSKYKLLVKFLNNVVNKVYDPSKTAKKLTKIQLQEAINQRNRGIMGIGLLFVVVSIAYSTTVILIGVDSIESKIALLPQMIFALTTLFKAFFKLYK